jgi:hypothetical protein
VSRDKPRLQEPHSIQDQNIAIINKHIDQPYTKKVCPDYQNRQADKGLLQFTLLKDPFSSHIT